MPQAWRQALADGLGMPAERLGELDEAKLRLVGELLREATRGTVELLVARTALKRLVRTEVTIIVAKNNNPLKVSPNVDAALQHLLGPSIPGFVPPEQAMRDAMDDSQGAPVGGDGRHEVGTGRGDRPV